MRDDEKSSLSAFSQYVYPSIYEHNSLQENILCSLRVTHLSAICHRAFYRDALAVNSDESVGQESRFSVGVPVFSCGKSLLSSYKFDIFLPLKYGNKQSLIKNYALTSS